MNDSLEFLFKVYMICIGVSFANLIVTLFFIIPLQFEKFGVKNGLQSLRRKLLAKGILSLIMSVIVILVLTSRFYTSGEIVRYLNTLLIFCFVVIWFIKQLIESSIYHTQFTEDQIRFHNKIFAEEQREELAKHRKKPKHLTPKR